jgi:hypothetical protein
METAAARCCKRLIFPVFLMDVSPSALIQTSEWSFAATSLNSRRK